MPPRIMNPRPMRDEEQHPHLSILDRIRADPKFTQKRSIDWFKQKINLLGGNSPAAKTDLLVETKHLQTYMALPGAMHFFAYDPKYKEELPFYDKFPLALVFSAEGDSFTGLQWHYMPYKMRAVLFEKMWMIASRYHNNREQCLRLNWKLFSNFSKFPEAQFVVKKYLYSHVRSRLIKVPVEDWKTAIMLPVEQFAKKSQAVVARDTAMKIRKSQYR